MNKLVFGLLGALALGFSALPSAAAPAIAAPVTTAMFRADGTDAHVQTVQYRQETSRHRPPHRRHHRHRRNHRQDYRGH